MAKLWRLLIWVLVLVPGLILESEAAFAQPDICLAAFNGVAAHPRRFNDLLASPVNFMQGTETEANLRLPQDDRLLSTPTVVQMEAVSVLYEKFWHGRSRFDIHIGPAQTSTRYPIRALRTHWGQNILASSNTEVANIYDLKNGPHGATLAQVKNKVTQSNHINDHSFEYVTIKTNKDPLGVFERRLRFDFEVPTGRVTESDIRDLSNDALKHLGVKTPVIPPVRLYKGKTSVSRLSLNIYAKDTSANGEAHSEEHIIGFISVDVTSGKAPAQPNSVVLDGSETQDQDVPLRLPFLTVEIEIFENALNRYNNTEIQQFAREVASALGAQFTTDSKMKLLLENGVPLYSRLPSSIN